MLLEACVETYDEAVAARQNGADRLELCSRIDLDGLSPSPDLIRQVCSDLKIPVMVMIRPREGSFVYSAEEIKVMESEIEMAKSSGASGIVLGLLDSKNKIDIKNCLLLTAAASPLPVTFHKAIDCLEDPVEGVRDLKNVRGIKRILTSGGKPTAREGAAIIREMIMEAADRIIIIAAGKVTRSNVAEICALTGAVEFHGRRIVFPNYKIG